MGDVLGGVSTFTGELARALAARGEEVHLALLGPVAAARTDRLPVASCEVAELRLEWMEDPWEDVAAAAEWIAELTRRHRPDVLHMNTFTPVLEPTVPVLLSAHSCVLSWWRAVHGCEAPPEWTRYRDLVMQALARAAQVVVPSRALLRELHALYELPERTQVIPNGRQVTPVPALREPLTVTVGRLWDPAKNFALMAAAAPAIEGRVVAVGEGRVKGVEQTGQLDETGVIGWLSRAAVFAEPARYEPFGLSALEAALCGCALVLGDIPSLREVWGDGATYVAVEDPQMLARVVNDLLHDPRRRALMVRAAAARASRYTPAAMAAAYLEAYRAAMGQRKVQQVAT